MTHRGLVEGNLKKKSKKHMRSTHLNVLNRMKLIAWRAWQMKID
jgi:hypothetical protein